MIRNEKEEFKRRKLEIWLLFPLVFFFIFLNWVLFRFNDVENALPLSYALFFFGLVNLNVFIFLGIVFFLGRNLVKLYTDSKPKMIGKTLKARLFIAFVSFAFIPTSLMFLVSVFYINNSFDRWFSNQTQTVLENSTRLTNHYISDIKTDLFYRANRVVKNLDPKKITNKSLQKIVLDMGMDALEYYEPESKEYFVSIYAEKSGFYLPKIEWEKAQKKGKSKKNQSLVRKSEQGEWLSAVVHFEDSKGFIVASQVLPFTLTETIDSIVESRQDFQKTKAFRIPLKSTYLFILITMTLVILAFGGWFSLYLAQSMSKSLSALGAATKRISKGDFNLIRFKTGMQEINELVINFNRMTTELKNTRENLNDSMNELEQRSIYMNTVLSQVSSGVISIDENFKITYLNKRAEQIFSLSESDKLPMEINSFLPPEVASLITKFQGDQDEIQVHELDIEISKDKTLSLQVSLATLLSADLKKVGTIVTVEKVDLLRENQRVKAWKEVATKVAHEIKNPLTPVKLSAERLSKKFSADIKDPVFNECIKTIIYHVDLIKNLVNEFNQFARFPQMTPSRVDVKTFFDDLVSSYRVSHPRINFDLEIESQIESMVFDPEKIRRVFINLIENAIEALKKSENKRIALKIRKSQSSNVIEIFIADNGVGLTAEQRKSVFRRKFTTKSEQGGLGLSIVKKIVEDHGGRVSLVDSEGFSTAFCVELPDIKI